MATGSALTHLECSRCRHRHDADALQNLCRRCGAPLLARYDLDRVAAEAPRDAISSREPTLWRYGELLPVRTQEARTSYDEGWTPLLPLPRLGVEIGVPGLLVKDESPLPGGTFKARGAAVGVSRARELGVRRIAMPSNGNAGAAWSAYAARAGLEALVAMPVDAPAVTRAEVALSGARLALVRGLIGDAGRMVSEVVAAGLGWFDVSTLKEPYRIEGKKTMGLEIAEQLGWRMPDVVVYPTGGGVGLIGIWKALQELLALGWVAGRLPRLVAVQSTGCAPVVAAWEAGAAEVTPWSDARTVAFGITVPAPLGGALVLQALADTDGCAIAVPDEETLAEQRRVAACEGLFVCPEGAAAFAAVRKLRASGWLDGGEEVVVLNTGSGLVYPEVPRVEAPVLGPRDSLLPLAGVSDYAS